MTSPALSVRRSSRPLCRKVSRVWSSPSRCRIVAWRSCTCTRSTSEREADRVGRAVDRAPFDAAAGQPVAEAVRVVIAALAALGHRHAAEFASPDHQRALEQPAPLQVFEQAGDRLVGPAAHHGMVRLDVVVGVPAVDVARVELNEPDSALDQPARQQAAGAELGGPRLIQP